MVLKSLSIVRSVDSVNKPTFGLVSFLNFGDIYVDFRDVYPFGGGLHCSTTDVYREGKCEDYFPKQ